MAIFNWRTRLDRLITSMGYVKADQRRDTGILSLFRGEAPLRADAAWAHFEEADWQRLAITSSWIYSDVTLIANTASKARLKVKQWENEDLVEVSNHPLELVERQPNPYMSRSFLWRYTLTWLQLRGEAYWWNVPDRTGQIAQLWPVPADRMMPLPDPQKFIRGYAYRSKDGGSVIELPPEVVTFFRLPNPFDYHRGLSPLSACRLGLQTDRKAQEWNLNTFEQGAPLKMLITIPLEASNPDLAMFRADIHEDFAAGRQYLIGRAGQVDAKQVGLAPADLEFLAGREFTREEIDRVFGIPAGFWAKEATRANSEAAEGVLLEHTVMPLHSLIAGQITTQLLPRYGEGLEAEFEDVRKEDRALVVEERKQYWQVYTIDEARAELGMDPYEDPLIGSQLVPVVTKGAPPGLGGGGGPSLPPESDEDVTAVREFKADIRRWRSIALRRLGRREDPAAYEFESAWIPPLLRQDIIAALKAATTEEEVKSAFNLAAPGGIGLWSAYP